MFKHYKLIQFILSSSVISMVILFITINALFFYPISITNIKCPIDVINKTVTPGSTLTYSMNYDKYHNISEIISQQLIVGDNIIVGHISAESSLDKDKKTVHMSILIPEDAPPGRAKIKIMLRYKLFYGMRIIDTTRDTEPFIITTRK